MTDHAREQAKTVIEQLRLMASWGRMGYTERFEADAEAFYRDTGMMAPGKSQPMEMPDHGALRESAWRAWNVTRTSAFVIALEFAADLLSSLQAREQAALAEQQRLREAIQTVLDTFQRDEAQGYRSRDRRFAIDILDAALSTKGETL